VKEFPFTLPSGRRIVLRESTGLDELAAFRRCGTKPEEQEHQQFELIASNVVGGEVSAAKTGTVPLGGLSPLSPGYESLLSLPSKDRQSLPVLWNRINLPTAAEVQALRASVVRTLSFPLSTFSFILPCGTRVSMHQCTGLEEFAAQRAFIGKPERESQLYRKWDELARCVARLGGGLSQGPPGTVPKTDSYSGFEDLFSLTSKSLACLFIIFTDENLLSGEELTGLRDFSATGSPSPSSQS
jgi:hypothetical protein